MLIGSLSKQVHSTYSFAFTIISCLLPRDGFAMTSSHQCGLSIDFECVTMDWKRFLYA